MRPIMDMDTVQIEVTNYCLNRCSNCTRLVGHHRKPYFMSEKQWVAAIDSMVGYPKMTGIMGGEPLLHPQFEEICNYLHSKIEPGRCGLWTCFPPGYEHYREVICRTFGHIFLNDHTRKDVLHTPILVHWTSIDQSLDKKPFVSWMKDYYQHHCWVQNSWSACINPLGAWFCEIAGALAMLMYGEDGFAPQGWKVRDGWFLRMPQQYGDQMQFACSICGAAFPLMKRESVDGSDDVCGWWAKRLKRLRSPKYLSGKAVVQDHFDLATDARQTATYKDQDYRTAIANRYGMFLINNQYGFQTPYLRKRWNGPVPILSTTKESHHGEEKGNDEKDKCNGEHQVRIDLDQEHPADRVWQEEVVGKQ